MNGISVPSGGGPNQAGERTRVRVRYAKLGKIRWTSHRDVARMWERAFRKIGLPLAYSGGFSPRPRVSFGLALPTGHESLAEYIDVELESAGVDLDALVLGLSRALPEGVDALAAAVVPPGTPSLQEAVAFGTWTWVVAPSEPVGGQVGQVGQVGQAKAPPPVVVAPPGPEEINARIEQVLASPALTVNHPRKGVEQAQDIRPGIFSLTLEGPAGLSLSDGFWLRADLACQPRSVRPSEVTLALGPGLEQRRPRRLHQWILRDGVPVEPLEVALQEDLFGARHAEVRAS